MVTAPFPIDSHTVSSLLWRLARISLAGRIPAFAAVKIPFPRFGAAMAFAADFSLMDPLPFRPTPLKHAVLPLGVFRIPSRPFDAWLRFRRARVLRLPSNTFFPRCCLVTPDFLCPSSPVFRDPPSTWFTLQSSLLAFLSSYVLVFSLTIFFDLPRVSIQTPTGYSAMDYRKRSFPFLFLE